MYRVWLADTTEADGEDYETGSAYRAAERFAEYVYHNCDGWEWMKDGADFMVREDDGEPVKMWVAVEVEPTFLAHRVTNV